MIYASVVPPESLEWWGYPDGWDAEPAWSQKHAPNLILLAVRDDNHPFDLEMWEWAFDAEAAFGGWGEWDATAHPCHILTLCNHDEIGHARRVVSRLITLKEIAS